MLQQQTVRSMQAALKPPPRPTHTYYSTLSSSSSSTSSIGTATAIPIVTDTGTVAGDSETAKVDGAAPAALTTDTPSLPQNVESNSDGALLEEAGHKATGMVETQGEAKTVEIPEEEMWRRRGGGGGGGGQEVVAKDRKGRKGIPFGDVVSSSPPVLDSLRELRRNQGHIPVGS